MFIRLFDDESILEKLLEASGRACEATGGDAAGTRSANRRSPGPLADGFAGANRSTGYRDALANTGRDRHAHAGPASTDANPTAN